MLEVADRWAGGRLLSVLEGGYNLHGLAAAAMAHVETLSGETGATSSCSQSPLP